MVDVFGHALIFTRNGFACLILVIAALLGLIVIFGVTFMWKDLKTSLICTDSGPYK